MEKLPKILIGIIVVVFTLITIAVYSGHRYGKCDGCNQTGIVKRFESQYGATYYYCNTCTDYAKFFE